MKGIAGVTALRIDHEVGQATRIELALIAEPNYDANHLIYEPWGDLFPGRVIVKCVHCGQWGARKTVCKHCGAPVE